MKLFLGIDGGQSSTVALIGDETGRVLGAGRGGPCNHVVAADGHAKFARAIHECLAAACFEARLNVDDISFEFACLGFSGGAEDKETYSREFIRARALKITHDAEIALAGATAGEPGIIVIAGTGSIAYGRNAQDVSRRAGGWGYLFGDEGGAFDLGKQALRSALAMEEGWGPPTALHAALVQRYEAGSANEMLHNVYREFSRQQVAQWALLVDQTALAGDAVALAILEQAAVHLANLVRQLNSILFPGSGAPLISYIGGVFASHLLTTAWKREIGATAKPPRFAPAAGALLLALRLAGVQATLSDVPPIKT